MPSADLLIADTVSGMSKGDIKEAGVGDSDCPECGKGGTAESDGLTTDYHCRHCGHHW